MALTAAAIVGALLVAIVLTFAEDALRALRYPVDEYLGKDGTVLVRVPGGDEASAVVPKTFFLQRFEVTNRSYARFVEATKYGGSPGLASYLTNDETRPWKDVDRDWRTLLDDVADRDRPNHPVVGVSFADASAYCAHYRMRLPRTEEWAYAARGGAKTPYWWGAGIPRFRRVGNFADRSLLKAYPKFLRFGVTLSGYDDGFARTAPVGTFEPNAYGLHDMVGNVWEWIDGACKKPNQAREGGSWSANEHYLSVELKNCIRENLKSDDTGFRCAMNLDIVR